MSQIQSDCITDGRIGRVGWIRELWEEHFGRIPDLYQVCHHCDNKACTNIAHLFLGTQSDNMMDCVNKGRHKGNRKLTWEIVREIRLTPNKTAQDWAKELGVSSRSIREIKGNHRWREKLNASSTVSEQ